MRVHTRVRASERGYLGSARASTCADACVCASASACLCAFVPPCMCAYVETKKSYRGVDDAERSARGSDSGAGDPELPRARVLLMCVPIGRAGIPPP
eukprot:6203393-Pleurochrysis_carterae.AAC.3